MSVEAKCKTTSSWEYRSPLQNDLTINKQDESSVQKSVNDGVKRNSPGRPKKSATVSLRVISLLILYYQHYSIHNYNCNYLHDFQI